MIALAMPPFLTQFMDWVEKNPALGAVTILVVVVLLLWLIRKSLKFFMVAVALLGITILVSYYYYGPQTTNEAVKRGAQQVTEHGKDLFEKTLRKTGAEEFGPDGTLHGVDPALDADPKSEPEG